MKPSRQYRVVAALIALVGMLFTQLVVVGFLCPQMQFAHASELVAASAVSEQHRAMPGCGDMSGVAAADCHKQANQQSLDKPELPQLGPYVALALAVVLVDDAALQRYRSASHPPPVLQRNTAPPLAIRNCCFRI